MVSHHNLDTLTLYTDMQSNYQSAQQQHPCLIKTWIENVFYDTLIVAAFCFWRVSDVCIDRFAMKYAAIVAKK